MPEKSQNVPVSVLFEFTQAALLSTGLSSADAQVISIGRGGAYYNGYGRGYYGGYGRPAVRTYSGYGRGPYGYGGGYGRGAYYNGYGRSGVYVQPGGGFYRPFSGGYYNYGW